MIKLPKSKAVRFCEFMGFLRKTIAVGLVHDYIYYTHNDKVRRVKTHLAVN
jgi:hypothetical protein